MIEKLKIFTVTNNFLMPIKDFLGEIGDVELLPRDWEKDKEFEADLIVFTGGEDIDPALYGLPFGGTRGSSRDRWEIHVLNSILNEKLKTKKVLGICRGLQLINVGMGGSLIQDIWSKFGEEHKSIHELSHRKTSIFNWLTTVNSMHHQGLERFGNSVRKYPINILATESRTGVAEIVLWGNMLLGFQFHPEFFGSENPSKKRISDILFEWITEKTEIIPGQSSKRNMWLEEELKKREVLPIPQELRLGGWEDTAVNTNTVFINTGRIQFNATENEQEAND